MSSLGIRNMAQKINSTYEILSSIRIAVQSIPLMQRGKQYIQHIAYHPSPQLAEKPMTLLLMDNN